MSSRTAPRVPARCAGCDQEPAVRTAAREHSRWHLWAYCKVVTAANAEVDPLTVRYGHVLVLI
ncbi:MAG: hypothetical protein ACM3ZE_01015, partial [Myxococcales bacterium]